MPEGITQFKDDFPIVGNVPIADASRGYEAGAQVMGEAAQFAGQKATQMAEEKSNFMLMEANNQAEDLRTTTKIQIKQHPDMADSIMESYTQSAEGIKSNTHVNKGDRLKLDSLMNSNKNDLRMTAANEDYRIQKRNAEIKLWGGYATNMKAVQDAIDSGNLDEAKKRSETLVKAFRDAAYTDVVSPNQYSNVLKSVGMLYDRAAALHNMATSGESDSQSYHRLYPSPFDNDSTDKHKLPVNQTTLYLHTDGMNDKSMSGVERAILNNDKIPFSVAAASDENALKTQMWLNGKNAATSLIDSGNKFKIDTRMADLETKVKKSPSEEMEYNYLKQYQQRLLNGESQRLMAETPMGSRIVQDFNDRLNAIKVGGYSDAEAYKLTRDAYNNMVDNSISYWDAQHIDPRLNQPIPPEISAPIAQAFQKGGDANVALERMSYLDNYQKQAYAARAMPDPIARETMQTVALANNTIGVRPEWKKSLIEAQQPMELKDLAIEKGDAQKIKNQIAAQASDIISYLSIGTDKNDPRSQAFLDMMYNKVIYDGIKKGDLTMSKASDYIADNLYNVQQAYKITSGISNTANLAQLNISSTDWSYISRHEQNEVYRTLYKLSSKADIQAAIDRNPLTTTITSTNNVVVMDMYGNVLSNHPYSDKLRIKAMHDISAEDVESVRQGKASGAMAGINPIRYGY